MTDETTPPAQVGVSCWCGHTTAARSGGVRASSSGDHHSGAGRRCGGRGRDAGDTGHHRAGVPGAGADHHGGSDPRLVDPARRVACGGVGCGVPDGVRDHGRVAGRRGRRDRSAGHPDAAVFRPDPAGTQRPAIPAGRDRGDPGRYPVGVRQHQPQSDRFLRREPAVQHLGRLLLRAVHARRGDLPRGGRHGVRRAEGEVGSGSRAGAQRAGGVRQGNPEVLRRRDDLRWHRRDPGRCGAADPGHPGRRPVGSAGLRHQLHPQHRFHHRSDPAGHPRTAGGRPRS